MMAKGTCIHATYYSRQGSRDAKIGDVHLRTHHYKNSETRRQRALGTGSKETKVNESAHVGGLLCFCLCRVLLCLSV